MDRKKFIRSGLLGTAIFATGGAAAKVVSNKIDELVALDVIGFNHLPNEKSEIMANMVYHPANSRGLANHGWLESKHTFSFANYYNPDRMHFGVLRVLNDDIVAGGQGFGKHPHDNMEIISIPLEGDLQHQDSMGNSSIIKQGDIQVMSAGTGIQHSEFNANEDKAVKFLQIWLFPNKRDVTPRYDQITLKPNDTKNHLQQILSPNQDDDGVWIHQNAWFHMGEFENQKSVDYQVKRKGNGVYAFVLKGSFDLNGQSLNTRDGLGIWDTDQFNLTATSDDAKILLMDVPMELS